MTNNTKNKPVYVPPKFGGEIRIFCIGTLFGSYMDSFLNVLSVNHVSYGLLSAAGCYLVLGALAITLSRSARSELFASLYERNILYHRRASDDKTSWSDTGSEV